MCSYQQPTNQISTARVRRPLGHSGGGPPLDTCAQPAATPHPYPEGPGTESDGAVRSPELSFGARRRGAPSLGLGAPGFIFISKLLRESTFKPSSKKQPQIHICSLKSWSVVCTIVVMARAGKSTAGRPSASTHIQDQDPSQVQEPGGDRETFQEQPPTQHTPVRDARNVIELNQYKYTNVPVTTSLMRPSSGPFPFESQMTRSATTAFPRGGFPGADFLFFEGGSSSEISWTSGSSAKGALAESAAFRGAEDSAPPSASADPDPVPGAPLVVLYASPNQLKAAA
ncbi:hypothetical protein AgCh_009855 [Apium graveolens]